MNKAPFKVGQRLVYIGLGVKYHYYSKSSREVIYEKGTRVKVIENSTFPKIKTESDPSKPLEVKDNFSTILTDKGFFEKICFEDKGNWMMVEEFETVSLPLNSANRLLILPSIETEKLMKEFKKIVEREGLWLLGCGE